MRISLFSSLLMLALTGCSWDPTFMPSGYTYEGNEYKTPTGPEARSIGYEYSAAENQKIIQEWRDAAADLVLRAKTNNLLPAAPIYLTTTMSASASQAAFDSALREELNAQGSTLVRDAGQGAALLYTAEKAKMEADAAADAQEQTQLTLGVPDEKGELGQSVSGLYDLPLYGVRSIGLPSGGSFIAAQESTRDDYNN